MAAQPETKLHRAIQARLRREYGARIWLTKVHSSGYLRRGVPDLLICVDGRAVALEVKTPNGRVSEDQERELAAFDGAGGTAAVVRSPDEAARVVALALAT